MGLKRKKGFGMASKSVKAKLIRDGFGCGPFWRDLTPAGTMRNGVLSAQRTWGFPISVSDNSLWPTPQASDSMRLRMTIESLAKVYLSKHNDGAKKSSALPYVWAATEKKYPSANLYEAMMGFPQNWTNLE